MFRPREQQRTGHFWEPHVQHKHKGCWGEGCPLWPQSQHHLHHGLMSKCEWETGKAEHTKVNSHGFFTQVHRDVYMSPFLTTHNKDTELSRNTKHIFGKTLMALDQRQNLGDYWEMELPDLLVVLWREGLFTLCECFFMNKRASGI